MDRRPTFKHRLEFLALGFVFLLGRFLPRSFFVWLGAAIGGFVHDVLKVRRAVTRANLHAAFPDMPEAGVNDLARRVYEQLGSSILEFAALPGMDDADLRRAVHIENLEIVDGLMAQGRGIMFVTPHFGSWELFGASFVAQGYPTTFFVKRQKNPLVADLQDDIRRVLARTGGTLFAVNLGVRRADANVMQDPNFQALLIRGLQWAGGRTVAAP